MAIVIGYLGGAWADRRLYTAPWLTLLGVLCGIAAGFKELYRVAVRHRRRVSDEERARKEDSGT